ncbi:MAG TPA: hypothetical protein VND95_06360 [Stellaceae bacterium]|nr:hypothetical protein [Stellaceae bacterium]
MKDLRSPQRLIRMWHRRQKAAGTRVVSPLGAATDASRTTHSAFTAAGQAVEDQVRKAWRPSYEGLAVF